MFTTEEFAISILSLYAEGDRQTVLPDHLSIWISILSLYAEGDRQTVLPDHLSIWISILSLYAEGDPRGLRQSTPKKPFQSSPSMQRETTTIRTCTRTITYFNPLPLCRGRLPRWTAPSACRTFQSSPSMQRETRLFCSWLPQSAISILSLYAEGDGTYRSRCSTNSNFNPLPLCRGRPF